MPVITKSKISVGNITKTISGAVGVAVLLGFFSSTMAYSAMIGEFRAANFKVATGVSKPRVILGAYLSNGVVNQNVVSGTQAQVFAQLVLDASQLTKDVEVREINFQVTTFNTNPAEVSNFSIYNGSTRLATTNDPDSETSTKTIDGDMATLKFSLVNPLRITAGTSQVLTVKGDVSAAASDGVFQVGIRSYAKREKIYTVEAYYLDNLNKLINVNVTANPGAAMTFVSSGNLAITLNAGSTGGVMQPGSTNNDLAIFDFLARYEDVLIEKIYVTGVAYNNGGWDQINQLHLYNGSTLVESVTPTSTDGVDRTVLIDLTNNPIIVPKDSTLRLTFRADASDIPPGEWNQGIALKINSGDVRAIGTLSGTIVNVMADVQGLDWYFPASN